jgi:hypothetical protein
VIFFFKMNDQEYNKFTKLILEELKDSRPNFKEGGPQEYFYNLKLKEPEKYEGLIFSKKTETHPPFSRDLSSIFHHLRDCGFLDLDNNVLFE